MSTQKQMFKLIGMELNAILGAHIILIGTYVIILIKLNKKKILSQHLYSAKRTGDMSKQQNITEAPIEYSDQQCDQCLH